MLQLAESRVRMPNSPKSHQQTPAKTFTLGADHSSLAPIHRGHVSAPPRRVPSLYPTSPPTTLPAVEEETHRAHPRKHIAHSMRPKPAPVTMESLREQRNAATLTHEESVEQSLYALFDVDPSVSEDELRRAYKRMWACFHPDHFSAYGLYSRAQLEALLNELQSGFELLMDPIRRREYDAELFPEGRPQPQARSEVSSRLAPTLQPLISKQEAQSYWVSPRSARELGACLKRLREECNSSLTSVHERSKISFSVLQEIESDDWDRLPAPIYLKGFIRELLSLYSLLSIVNLDVYIKEYRGFCDSSPSL